MNLAASSLRRWRLGALMLVLSGLLAGCGLVVDANEARLCRALASGLNPGADRLKITSIRSISRRSTDAHPATSGVALDYEITTAGRSARSAFLACHFTRNRDGVAHGRHLQAVEADDEVFGPVRLYVARRFWLDTPEGAAADPEPIPGRDHAGSLPRPVAVVLQSLLASSTQTGIYVLLALAASLVHGLVGRINLALGDLAALASTAAALGVAVAGGTSAPIVAIGLGLTLAVWTAGLYVAVASHVLFSPLSSRPGQAMLIASVAVGLSVAELVRIAQVSGSHPTPPLLDAPMAVAQADGFIVTATPMALLATVAAGTMAGVILGVMQHTHFGRSWRACADDAVAAAVTGVDVRRLGFATFALAGIIAGGAGALLALSYGSANPGAGLGLGLKGVIAAILGGVGSLGGAALAGLAIGLAEALWSIVLPIEHRDVALFSALVALLILRPGGLAGRPEMEPRH